MCVFVPFDFDAVGAIWLKKCSTHFRGLFAVTARLAACFYSVIREINAEVFCSHSFISILHAFLIDDAAPL